MMDNSLASKNILEPNQLTGAQCWCGLMMWVRGAGAKKFSFRLCMTSVYAATLIGKTGQLFWTCHQLHLNFAE